MKIVCYKARFRARAETNYDRLWPVEVPSSEGVEFVMFADVPKPCKIAGWTVLPQVYGDKDFRRRARHHKVMAHELFPDADYTLWLDGVFTPKVDIGGLVKEYSKAHQIVAHRHPHRICLYDEASAILKRDKDNALLVHQQITRYRKEGMPRRFGLNETGALLRKNTPEVAALNRLWWQEINGGSFRDQVSFNYCLWKLGLKASSFRGSTKASLYFRWRPHHTSGVVARQLPVASRPTIDILLPLGDGSVTDDAETRFTLRSIEKHAKGWRRIVIVGHKPKFLNDSPHCRIIQHADIKANKEARIAAKIAWAFENAGLSDEVCVWNDDYVLMDSIDVRDIENWNRGKLADSLASQREGDYRLAISATRQELEQRGLPSYHYDIHVPIVYNRVKYLALKEWWERSRKTHHGYLVKSVYCNNYLKQPGPQMEDCKVVTDLSSGDLERKIRGRWVFSYADEAVAGYLGRFLWGKFPDKSSFEKSVPVKEAQPALVIARTEPVRHTVIPKNIMRKFYRAENTNRPIKSAGFSFDFENYGQVGGSWRGTFTTDNSAAIAALDTLASDRRVPVWEIDQNEYERLSQKKIVESTVSAVVATRPTVGQLSIEGRPAVLVENPEPPLEELPAGDVLDDLESSVKTGKVKQMEPVLSTRTTLKKPRARRELAGVDQ